MNTKEHLLTTMAEECNEVAHRISKALRFGLDEVEKGQKLTNAERIREEFVQLMAVKNMLEQHGHLTPIYIPLVYSEPVYQDKINAVEKWMKHARKNKTLTGK